MLEIRHILCPVDGSAPSLRAVDMATGLAEQVGADLHLMYAYRLPVYVGFDPGMRSGVDLTTSIVADATASLASVERRIGDRVGVSSYIAHGAPEEEVRRAIERLGIDLVVLGTHGRTGLSRMLIGSVAERVIRTCPVPVITVPIVHADPQGTRA